MNRKHTSSRTSGLLASALAVISLAGLLNCSSDATSAGEGSPGKTSQALETISPFKELVIADSSVVLDVRASNDTDGHWSFRWLVEQMTPAGVDPGTFAEDWLLGFHVGSVNGFSMDDRSGVTALLAGWPRTATGQLDLARSPFRLLAITNRLDLDTAPNGEARFVFGLVNGAGQGQSMSVIFEYKLAPLGTLDDRAEWARRWHALGGLAFGDPYNQALTSVTDAFAAAGADPAGINGSSLNQVRTNEIVLGAPWELREFRLGVDAGGAVKLAPATTAQNPDQSLNGATALEDFLVANRDAVLGGTHVIPSAMLGGNAPENFTQTTWRFDPLRVDEPLRKAFASSTCNGCHNGETAQIDSFYQVSPLRPIVAGGDGLDRLSSFIKVDDLPQRISNMQTLLGPALGPAAAHAARTRVD